MNSCSAIRIVFIAVLVLLLLTTWVSASITSPTVISSQGYYILENDIINGTINNTIEIRSSDVIFDGMNHTIDGMDGNLVYTNDIWVGDFPAFLDNITIQNVTLKNRSHGIFFRNVTNAKAINCTIDQVGQDGIRLEGSASLQLSGNTITNSSIRGISLTNSTSTRISGNAINNNMYGILLVGSNDNLILSNHVFANQRQGIHLNQYSGSGSNNNTISWNTAESNRDSGIFINSSCNNTVSDNTITNNTYTGIFLQSTEGNTIYHNWVNGSILYYGIRVNVSHHNLIHDNAFVNNSGSGIELDSSSDNLILRNFIGNNRWHGIQLAKLVGFGSDNNSILQNNVTGNSENGVIIFSSDNNSLSGNFIVNNSFNGIKIESANTTVIDQNRISDNGYRGILLKASYDSRFSNNTVLSNTLGIETISNASGTQIFNNYFDNPVNVGNTTPGNIWNISRTPGLSIIGGLYRGGNYWSDYAGIDTDGDGIGDTLLPYTSNGNITAGGDWLPLIKVTAPPAGGGGIMFRFNTQHTGDYSPVAGTTGPVVSPLWNFTTGGFSGALDPSPTVANGVVYIGSADYKIYAVNATTGAELWNVTTGNSISSSPAVAYGMVYIGSEDLYLYALNASTGLQVWNYTNGNYIYSSPAVENNTVYFADATQLHALNAATGTQIWSQPVGTNIYSSPAAANDVVYIGSNSLDYLFAFGATNGTQLWHTPSTGSMILSSPAVANGAVYFGSGSKVYAVNATTGGQLWTFTDGGLISSSPAVANGIVYIGGAWDGRVYALDAATGMEVWNQTTGGGIISSPAIANGIVYIGSSDHTVYAFDAANGSQVWAFTTGNTVASSPAIANGVLYIESEDNNLYALRLGEGVPPTVYPPSPSSAVKLIFIHHSTGEHWLDDANGGLGIALRDNNYFVSDTNYGWGPDSIGSLTDIGNWYDWFRGPQFPQYLGALFNESGQYSSYSRMVTDPGGPNSIVMFKSCFPNSALQGLPSDPVPAIQDNLLKGNSSGSEFHTIANAKGIYIDLLNYFQTRPDTLFIVVSAPPLADPTYAANARAFNEWLVNDWLDGYTGTNVFVFDFYNVLTTNGGDADTNDLGLATGNHHRWWNASIRHDVNLSFNTSAYPTGPSDDHPTRAGNLKATAEFIPLLNYAYNRWAEGASHPVANFTANVTSGPAPLAVQFNDTSDCHQPLSWYWEFGDGNTSTVQNPVFTYRIPGTYSVNLRITNASGSDWKNRTAFIQGMSLATRGRIVFASNRDGNTEIYAMSSDGNEQIRLTNNSAVDYFAALSPNGTEIVFTSDRDGGSEIYVMNADGKKQTRLTNNSAYDGEPAWSPDGTKVAFVSERDGSVLFYMMNADGSGQTKLTNNSAADHDPDWSPDGTKITFTSGRDGNWEIYVMNADGSGQTRLTDNSVADGEPDWSPDGTKIAFVSYRDGNGEVYVMNVDGSGQTRLTNNPADDLNPAWSPDGTKIAFTSERDGNFEIYVMNVDGSGQTRLTNNPEWDIQPDWGREPEHVGVTGDFNVNGRVDIGDVVRVAYIAAGLLPEDLDADFDASGHVEVGDAARIAWYYVGKIAEL